MMKSQTTTLVLLALITLLALWRSGKFQTWMNRVFA